MINAKINAVVSIIDNGKVFDDGTVVVHFCPFFLNEELKKASRGAIEKGEYLKFASNAEMLFSFLATAIERVVKNSISREDWEQAAGIVINLGEDGFVTMRHNQ